MPSSEPANMADSEAPVLPATAGSTGVHSHGRFAAHYISVQQIDRKHGMACRYQRNGNGMSWPRRRDVGEMGTIKVPIKRRVASAITASPH